MASSWSADRSRLSAGTEATRQGVTATREEVRAPAFQVGALAEECSRTVLGQALAVDLDAEHTVEH